MTATLSKLGYGTLFQTDYTLASPTVWVTISEAATLSLPPLSRDAVDASHECAPDEYRTFVTGLKSGGEISVTMNFIAAQYITLQGELSSTTPKPRRIVLPGGSIMTFSATLIGLEVPVAVGEKMTATAKFKIDGAPALLV